MTSNEKIYSFLCVFFAVLIVVSNITYQKFVSLPFFQIHEFHISVGAILYPLTFLITDLIAEFYGKEKARFCVKIALVMNIFTAIVIFCMDNLAALPWSVVDDDTFHHVFGMYSVAFIGSLLACYTSQSLDVYLYLLLKKITMGKLLWIRNVFSTSISLLIDTTIVISFMAIFGIFQIGQAYDLIINSYSFKLVFTLLNAPLFYFYVYIIRKIMNNKI